MTHSTFVSRRAALTGLAGTALFAAAPAFAAKKSTAPASVTIGSTADGLANADNLVTRYGKRSIPAGGRVVPVFQVELVEEAGKRVEDRKYHANATADTTFEVAGIPQAEVQAVVDKLYADYVAGLAAAGFTVLTPQEAEASEHWREMKAGLKPSPFATDSGGRGKSTLYGPSNLGIYIAAGDPRFMGSGFGALAGFGNVMDQANSEYAMPIELKAALVGMELAVGFVDIETKGGGKYSNIFGSGSASVKGKAAMTVIPERSRLWFLSVDGGNDGRQELVLTQTVLPAIDPVAGTEDVTSRGQKLGDAAGTVIGMFTGTGGAYSTKTFRINIDAAAFPGALEGSLSGVSAAMVQRLAGLPSAPAGKKR